MNTPTANPAAIAVPQPQTPAPPPSVEISTTSPLEFLWKTHAYTNEYIRFADPKAAIAIAISSGLLTALFAAKCHQVLYPSNFSWEKGTLLGTFVGLMSGPAFLLLATSIILSSWGVMPRLWRVFFATTIERLRHFFQPQVNVSQTGFIYWDEVLAHGDAATFSSAASQLTQQQMTEAVARHLYVLAGIASSKYKWVTWGFRCGYMGAIFACLALLAS